jgi:hypothetical protein
MITHDADRLLPSEDAKSIGPAVRLPSLHIRCTGDRGKLSP